MDRFNFESKIQSISSTTGTYILYSDHIKEIVKIKSQKSGDIALCPTCSKNKTCNPHNNYGVIAIECEKYKIRSNLS